MPDFEHKLVQRWSPMAFIKAGALVMLLGAAPLLLYALLGPADGNPIGLGLLMVVAVPIGFLLLGIGLLRLLIAWLQKQ
jgi:hypothetical protein